jgi:hypothetical protein
MNTPSFISFTEGTKYCEFVFLQGTKRVVVETENPSTYSGERIWGDVYMVLKLNNMPCDCVHKSIYRKDYCDDCKELI